MAFLYETHMHTCQGSGCGVSTGAEHARAYKQLGYTGIIITDHFFRGNTAVPHRGPWKERINQFCSGYEDAYREGQRIGLDVFFGWEENFNGDEYLVYGLDKAFMLAHPEMEHWTRAQQLEEVHKAGGCVIQAHPFRDRGYIAAIRLGKQFCDGIEAANAGNHAYNDAAAWRYGQEYGFVMTSGSDNHNAQIALEHPDSVTGVKLDKRLTCIEDWVKIILTRQPIGLNVEASRFDIAPDAPRLETFWMDEREQLVPTHRDWLHE